MSENMLHYNLGWGKKNKFTIHFQTDRFGWDHKEIPNKQQWHVIFKERSGDSKSEGNSFLQSQGSADVCRSVRIALEEKKNTTETQGCLEETQTIQTVPSKWMTFTICSLSSSELSVMNIVLVASSSPLLISQIKVSQCARGQFVCYRKAECWWKLDKFHSSLRKGFMLTL